MATEHPKLKLGKRAAFEILERRVLRWNVGQNA